MKECSREMMIAHTALISPGFNLREHSESSSVPCRAGPTEQTRDPNALGAPVSIFICSVNKAPYCLFIKHGTL